MSVNLIKSNKKRAEKNLFFFKKDGKMLERGLIGSLT